MPRKPRVSERIASAALSPSVTISHQRLGHFRLELEPDHLAAPAALDRGPEVTDQVFGFLLDFDVAVADHPERPAAEQLIFGEQIIGVAPDQRFQRDEARLLARYADEARQSRRGGMTSSRTGSPLPRRSSKISEKPRLGMNGKGWALSIACGVSRGKICSRKYLSSQASASGSSGSWPMTEMPALRRARLGGSPRLRAGWWRARRRRRDRGQLLGRGQPVDR